MGWTIRRGSHGNFSLDFPLKKKQRTNQYYLGPRSLRSHDNTEHGSMIIVPVLLSAACFNCHDYCG